MTTETTAAERGAMKLPGAGELKDHAVGISTAAIELFDDIEHGTISEAGLRAINEIGRLHDLIVGEKRSMGLRVVSNREGQRVASIRNRARRGLLVASCSCHHQRRNR